MRLLDIESKIAVLDSEINHIEKQLQSIKEDQSGIYRKLDEQLGAINELMIKVVALMDVKKDIRAVEERFKGRELFYRWIFVFLLGMSGASSFGVLWQIFGKN